MKILQVTNFFKPLWDAGGVAKSSYNICKNLAIKGHDVTVYTTFPTSRKTRNADIIKNKPVIVDGIKVYYFSNLKNFFPFSIPPFPYYSPFVIRKEIRNFDVIHIHEHRTILAVIVTHYARKYNVPYVIQPRGSAQKKSKTFLKTFFDLTFGYKILKNAKKIILSSKNEYSLSKEILKSGGVKKENIKYMANGLDSEFNERLKNRKNRLTKSDHKSILYLGRIHKRKGLDLLVDAYEKILDEKDMTNLNLIITGPDDGYEEELKRLVRKKKFGKDVIFTGPLYGDDKIDMFISSDVFVLPSIDQQESFGNVVLEASACGTPCVVTNVCGVTEWLENIVKVEPNIESIKNGIITALKMEKLGEKARKEVFEKFSWESIVKNNLIPIYEDIIDQR